MTLQNVTAFTWTKARLQAAEAVAEDRVSDDDIATQCGISRQTLATWKRHPDFQAKVAEHIARLDAAILQVAIARKAKRVQAQQARWEKMHRVIAERAEAPEYAQAPGGQTGLLVRTFKQIGQGPSAYEVEEFAVDTGLLKELREHEKLAAEELGQRVDKKDLTTNGKDLTFTIAIDRAEHDDGDA